MLHKNYNTAVHKLQTPLNKVHNWARRWKIDLNHDKPFRGDYALKQHGDILSVIGNQTIPLANAERCLGLYRDSEVNWAEHVKQKRDYLNFL